MSRDSWATPMPVYLAMDAEFDFSADICASHTNAKHPRYLTEEEDAFIARSMVARTGQWVWCNPPYSDITPWVNLAIDMQGCGVGTVMLVMADCSVGWYAMALEFCQEVREVINGRISFLDPETGKPVSGNNKGSLFFIFDPYGRQAPPRRTYVKRDDLIAKGLKIMSGPERMMALYAQHPPLFTERGSLSTEQEAPCSTD